MNNLLSYYGLVDARISTSEKDLPVDDFSYEVFILVFAQEIKTYSTGIKFIFRHKRPISISWVDVVKPQFIY